MKVPGRRRRNKYAQSGKLDKEGGGEAVLDFLSSRP